MIGQPIWIELFTSQPEVTRPFYSELFGWTAEQSGEEFGGYITYSTGGNLAAGSMHNDGQMGAPDSWAVYLHTADIDDTAARVEAAGGSVLMAPMDVMDLGRMALFTDPGAAVISAWQPGTHLGFSSGSLHGLPAWFELHTRAYDQCVAFYRDVFGWGTEVMSDTPEFRYTTLGEGDAAKAGIMDATSYTDEWSPGYWSIYFAVRNTDEAVQKAVELGGTLVTGPNDTPYGRLAELRDPTGLGFRIMG